MERTEIDDALARIEAALAAAEAAFDAGPPAGLAMDPADSEDGAGTRALEAELLDARQRVMTLESEAGERETVLGAALDRAEAAEGKLSARPAAEDGEVDGLRAQVAELRAVRAQDLAEMKTLLAELEPLMPEAAHA